MAIGYLAIGDELLRGDTREGNSHTLAIALRAYGLSLNESRQVSDDPEHIQRAVTELVARCGLVVITGGLGPTDDDKTRQALAALGEQSLVEDPVALAHLQRRYAARGRSVTPSNRRQALRPAGSQRLDNEAGTAPGFVMKLGTGWVATFPGVPREFQTMLTAHLSRLLEQAGLGAERRNERFMRIFGVSESDLQEWMRAAPGYEHVVIRSLPSFPEIRLFASSDDPQTLSGWWDSLVTRLGWRCWSHDAAATVGGVTIDHLRERGLRLAVAESCTGGLIGDLITDAPGVSDTFWGSFVCYSNELKTNVLGVAEDLIEAHGAVSEAVVASMAEGARRAASVEVGLATSGIAGPGGGTADKPVGTLCIGLSDSTGTRTWRYTLPNFGRARVKTLAAWLALAHLRGADPTA